MSVSQLEALYLEAVSAVESGDYDAAIRKAMAVKFRLATTANVTRALGGGGQQQLEWANQRALDGFIAECRKLKAQALAEASGGMQQTKIIYARPDTSDCYE